MLKEQMISTAEAMEEYGEHIGARLKGGELIELISDLGGGKTTLTRGIARGAGSGDAVGSPTFTISKVYKTPKYDIHHFDFYRLNEAGLMEHELHELLGDPNIVVIVEWGDVMQHVLPENRVTININKTPQDARTLSANCPETLNYLFEEAA